MLKPQMQKFDVTVIGAGPAAMIAGLSSAMAGFSTALVGPGVDLEDRRTTALLEPSIAHLDGLGLGERLESFATPMKTMRLLDGSRRLIRAPSVSFEAQEIGQTRFGLNCPNAALNAALDDAIRSSARITRFDSMAAAYDFEASEPVVTLRDGERLVSGTILGSDGRKSRARDAAGIRARRWSYPQTAVVGVVSHALPHEFISTELHTETGPFTFVPMPRTSDGGHQSSFVCVLSPRLAERLGAMDLADASRFLEDRSLHVLGALELTHDLQLWPLEGLVADTFGKPGLFLVGEAAHAFPPIGAQGLNLSIRDVRSAIMLLQEASAQGEPLASRNLAARFNSDRRMDVWSRTFAVDALNRSLLSNVPLVHLGRSAALSAAKNVPALRTGLMQLGLGPFSLSAAVRGLAEGMRPNRVLERLDPKAP